MNTVCITLNEDGTYGVYMKDEVAEGMPEAEPQTFESADEACQAAIDMLGGGMEEAEEPMMEGEDEFVQGFKDARGV